MMRRRFAIYIVCLILAILIFGSIIIAPRLFAGGSSAKSWGMIIYNAFRGLCHQDPARSYYWDTLPYPVCHRCIGIYGGALLGLLVYPFTRYFRKGTFPSLLIFLIFAVPVAIDPLLGIIGVWDGHPYVRTITGGMIAFIGSFYIVPGVDEMLRILFGEKKEYRGPPK